MRKQNKKKKRFVDDYSLLSMYELTLFIFTHISKNKLLLVNIKKKSYFDVLEEESGIARITFVMENLYTKLQEEFVGQGM